MARLLLALLLALLCLGPVQARKDPAPPATPTYTGPKKRLAVTDMEIKVSVTTATTPTTSGGVVTTVSVDIPPPTDFGQGLTEMLTTALVDSRRFIVLERKSMADVQAEQGLAGTAVDATTAPTAGKMLGAQVLVRGSVTEFTYRKSSTGGSAKVLKGIGLAKTSAEAAVVLDIRLIDTTTGQIIDSVKAEGRTKMSGVNIAIDKEEMQMSAASFSQSPLGQATRQAIERAVTLISERMEKIPFEARVAELDTDDAGATTLYLNAGAEAGLKEGDVLEVFRPGREILDPQTKLVIGRTRDKRVGACRIESVTAALAVAPTTEGTDFQKEDVVRLVPPPPPPQKR